MTRNMEFLAYAAVLAGVPLAAAARFIGRMYSEPEPASGGPFATVFVPCKGAPEGLAQSLESLLSQDYGPHEVLIVVPSPSDPAFAVAAAAAAAKGRGSVVTGGPVSPRCSGKISDLLAALPRASRESELLVFADADLRARPDWLRSLAAPVLRGEADIATSCMLYAPADAGLWSFMRLLWMAAGLPLFSLLGQVAGQSIAVRRRDFEALGVAGLWSRSLMEDLALSAAARAAGMRVAFAARAMTWAPEGCGAQEYFSLFSKWMTCFRVYDLRVWAGALGACFMRGWIVYWCLRAPATLWLPALLLGADALTLALVVAALRARLPDRFSPLHPRWVPPELWAALLSPLLWLTYAVQVLSSFGRTIRWQGRRYALRGPQDVEVVG